MIIVPKTYNGVSLQSTDFIASIPRSNGNLQLAAENKFVKRAGALPVFSGKDFTPTTYILDVECLGDYMKTFETLNKTFNVMDETPHQLVVKDTSDSDKNYFAYATPKNTIGGNDGAMARVTLSLDDPVWQSSTLNSQTFAITGTTNSTDVTVAGNVESYPIFSITPATLTSSDYPYSVYLQVLPQANRAWNNRAMDICGATDTTFDTAALIAASKMLANGNDLRVFRDGIEIDRWLSGINTTDTRVWVVDDYPAARELTLKTALTAGAETKIRINSTIANIATMKKFPNEGRIIIDTSLGSTDTEEFVYTSKLISGTNLYFAIDTRAARSTTAFAHAAGSNVRFLPYDYTIVYGYPSATAPDVDNTQKPIISLASTNQLWTYTNFWEDTAQAACIWRPHVNSVTNPALTQSGYYTSTNDVADVDPAVVAGLRAESYLGYGAWRPDTVDMEWTAYFSDGIASFAANGEQSQSAAAWPVARFQVSANDETYTTIKTIAAQVSTDYGTWTTWTFASTDVTIPAGMRYIRLWQKGTVAGSTDNYAKVGMDGATVGLTSYPHVMIRPETGNTHLNFTITNATTDEAFTIIMPTQPASVLTIDTNPDFPTVKYQGRIVNGTIILDGIRAKWMTFQPGSNTINFDNNINANNLDITIKWRDRMNFL